MKKKYDAIISGYTCVDMVPSFERREETKNISELLKPGKLLEIGGLDMVLGGVVPNTGLLMKYFGDNVFLNGLIGEDPVGKIAEGMMTEYGTREGIRKTVKAGTGYSIVLAPPGTDRIFLESPGCNRIFSKDNIDYKAISESRLFHFGYPPLLREFYKNNGKSLTEMYRKISEMGVITSMDMSLPDMESESGKVDWRALLKETLPYVDLFVPSLEEMIQIMNPGKYSEMQKKAGDMDIEKVVPLELIRDIGRELIEMGVKVLMIKMGGRGIYLRTGDISGINDKKGEDNRLNEENWKEREFICKASFCDGARVKNASGAGDTAIAAFLHSVLQGEDVDIAVRYAALAGRDSLYCESIFSDMSCWEELTQEMNEEPGEIFDLKK